MNELAENELKYFIFDIGMIAVKCRYCTYIRYAYCTLLTKTMAPSLCDSAKKTRNIVLFWKIPENFEAIKMYPEN